ncbi:MAG: hypothetical protein M3436_15155 [Pseudomonadota bacterium]|nr:hypothetical protein [Pseudomonadota bacterium]
MKQRPITRRAPTYETRSEQGSQPARASTHRIRQPDVGFARPRAHDIALSRSLQDEPLDDPRERLRAGESILLYR